MWVLVVVTWYGQTVNAEAVEVSYRSELECVAAQGRLQEKLEAEREKDSDFGYVIVDCVRSETDSDSAS